MSSLTESSTKNEVISNLRVLLSSTYVLYVKTQNFHWNVAGPRFQQLHTLFEEQYTSLASAIDIIAEQVRILDARPPSSLKEFIELSNIDESYGTLTENEMLSTLLNDHKTISTHLSEWIENAQENKDEATADLLIQRVREHDKIAWMIKSHLTV